MTGIVLITIGYIILGISPWTFREIVPAFSTGFMSVVAIMFGWAIIAVFPIKTLLKVLLGLGLWFFLFLLPLFMLPLPLEIPALVSGSSLLLICLVFAWYQKWKKKHKVSTC